MFQIRDILVRIRIQIYPDSDMDLAPDPAIFVSDFQDGNKWLFLAFAFAYFLKLQFLHCSR